MPAIEADDLIMPMMGEDREVIGFKLTSPTSEDELVIALKATDTAVGLKVVSMTKEDQIGLGATAADQEVVALTSMDCEPEVLGSFTTNDENPVWDLSEFLGPGIGPPGGYWRLIEVGYCLIYERGCIDGSGELVGLPDEFRSDYYYNGYMELQVGCLSEDDPNDIDWPGDCRTPESRSSYPSC